MKNKREKQLAITLLKERLERLSGKKVSLIELKTTKSDTELSQTQELKRAEHKAEVTADILTNRPSGEERTTEHNKLRYLIEKFQKDTERFEAARKPFLEQIDLIQKQLRNVEGELPDKLARQEDEIKNLMYELNITTKRVGDTIVRLETEPGRKNVKYKSIVEGIEAFEEFVNTYSEAYKQLVEKYTSFSEVRKSLILYKESYLLKEHMFSNLFKTISNMFGSLKGSLKGAINKGNNLVTKLERII